MKQIFRSLVLLLFVMMLYGCGSKTASVILFNPDNSIYQEYTEISVGEILELPVLEMDDSIFVGWSDGTDVFYDEIIIEEDVVLTAQFELVSEVFEYQEIVAESENFINIIGYNGTAKYLVIPAFIDDQPVRNLMSESFKESNLVEVWIPNTVDGVYGLTFKDSLSLEAVHFYGDFYRTYSVIMSQNELSGILEENADSCQVSDNDEENEITYYSSGCVVIQAELYDSIWVSGMEYRTYRVILDGSQYKKENNQVIYPYAFYGANNLKTLEINSYTTWISSEVFLGVPMLEEIIVAADNPKFAVVDGVLYSKDLKILYYVLSSVTEETGVFDVPETVEYIRTYAFMENNTVEIINIPASVTTIYTAAFYNTVNLKEINVDEENEEYYDIDGILYADLSDKMVLVCYPAGKTGVSYVLPDGVDVIDSTAFAYNQYLENIDLGESLQYIDSSAFYASVSLTVLDIPDSVVWISTYIVRDSNISVIIMHSTEASGLPTIIDNFYNTDGTRPQIYVPDDSYNAYIQKYTNYSISEILHPYSEYEEAE